MSLAVLADHMASKGRGPDSMLIHMSPREVQGLQALAENHGGSLTINPETGLPEAGFLDKLLPAILGFALAPLTAGTSLAFLGATPFASALTVGGLQTLRTGDIGKGISAGLGAYGGAGLQASLAGAGASALSGEATSLAANEAGKLAGEEAVRVGMQQGLSEEAINQLRMQAIDEAGSATARVATDATPFEKLTAGASQATSSPAAMGQFAKDNFKNIAYAAGPVLADQAVTSKLPVTTTRPGMISPYAFDPYSGTYTAATPYRAAGGGLMGMDDGGYSPGQLDFTQKSEPVVRMASGGIARYDGSEGSLVGGDAALAAYQAGNYGEASRLLGEAGMGAQDVVSKYGLSQADAATVAQNLGYTGDMSGITYGAPAAQAAAPNYDQIIADAYGTIGRSGVGEGTNQIDQGGYNHFLNMLQTGQVAPDSFNDVFQGAVTRYVADNPNDRYTQYVNDFRANQTGTGAATDTTGGLSNLAAANNIVNVTGATTGTNLNAFNNSYTGANINDYIANNKLDAAGIATAAKTFNVDPAQIVAAQNAQNIVTNVYRNVLGRDPDPAGLSWWTNQIMNGDRTGAEMYEEFKKSATSLLGTGGTKEIFKDLSLADAIKNYGGYQSADKRTIADEWIRNTLGREVTDADRKTQWYKDASNSGVMTTVGKAEDIYNKFKDFARDTASTTVTKQIADAKTLLASKGLSEMDVLRQTGKTIAELVGSGIKLENDLFKASQLLKPGEKAGFDFNSITKPKVITPITFSTAGTNAPGGLESIIGLPPGVSGAGITTVNPNGTITTRPDLTLGMGEVRDDYVRGGGSLGYTSPTFASLKAVEDKYPLRGGSKQSYDYLTGKTDYETVPYTKTGEIMKPYGSSVLGIPTASAKQMYLFDPATKTYKINPDYAIPTYDKDGKKSLAVTNQDIINYVKSPEYSNDDAFVSWMTANNLTPEQIAAATGMSIADVYKKIKKAKPVETVVDTPVTGQNDGGGGGGGDMADGGLAAMARGGMAQQFDLGGYSDGGRLLRGPGDGVSDSIPATIGNKRPARLADGEFVVPARIVSELGNGSTEAGARKLYAMMDRVQKARRGTVGKGRVAKNSRSEKYLPA